MDVNILWIFDLRAGSHQRLAGRMRYIFNDLRFFNCLQGYVPVMPIKYVL